MIYNIITADIIMRLKIVDGALIGWKCNFVIYIQPYDIEHTISHKITLILHCFDN